KVRKKYILDTSCIILAGGKGLRLGRDKVLETIGHRSLLEQVISCVSLICTDISIVITQERVIPKFTSHLNTRILTDTYPGKGPLAGIHAGLIASNSLYNLVVASDMPFLNQDLLRYMIELATEFDMVVPLVDNLVEPLHAIYSKNCLVPIEDMLKQDNLSVYQLLNSVKVRYVETGEIERFDPEHLSFFNINTKADLDKARGLAKRECEQ
ncbi:molybdenum cofactor guanylyltransferase, partial [Chloroflexota bacterium]